MGWQKTYLRRIFRLTFEYSENSATQIVSHDGGDWQCVGFGLFGAVGGVHDGDAHAAGDVEVGDSTGEDFS